MNFRNVAKGLMEQVFIVTILVTAGLTQLAISATSSALRVGPSTTLTFTEKNATLTANSKSQLDALIKEARANGQINEIQLAVWSDNPAPRNKEKLSSTDRDLTKRRAKAVDAYLSDHAKVHVSTYDMAERSSWLSRTFETEDAKFKKEIGRGGNSAMSKEEFQIFKDNGGPSRAVVLVILK